MATYVVLLALIAIYFRESLTLSTTITIDDLRTTINETEESLRQYKLCQRTYGLYQDDWESERLKAMEYINVTVQNLTAELAATDNGQVQHCISLLNTENQKILNEHLNRVNECYKIINGRHFFSIQKIKERHIARLLTKGDRLLATLDGIPKECYRRKLNESCIKRKTAYSNIATRVWQDDVGKVMNTTKSTRLVDRIRACTELSFNRLGKAVSCMKSTVSRCHNDSPVTPGPEETM
ncbi:uncharacterized protein LOC135169187 isoform X2 [Diachasmimorpha longicaudata]|uniref:uncharacterized protein LOC135169187 isoform X2 n=1 Tax=Diachasmimorpha longicaudata TaxID=58733 RepID=UPI0030B8ACF2